jgi:hypothetical protein
MKSKKIVYGPVLQTPSGGLVYSVTLLSGHIVTNPAGFGIGIESIVPADISIEDTARHLEDSGFTKKDFESDLIKASKRIKETKPSPKSS